MENKVLKLGGGEVTSLDLNLAGAGETKVIGVKSITL